MGDSPQGPPKQESPGEARGSTKTHYIPVQGSSVTARTKANFAVHHLLAAARFARMTGAIENLNAGRSSPDSAETTAYVTAALLTASAAIEAYINEVFINGQVFPVGVPEGVPEDLWEIWWEQIERKRRLEKYDLALGLRGKVGFTKDKRAPDYPRYLSATRLIEVRDALMHFKPQWDDEAKGHHNIMMELRKEQVRFKSSGTTAPIFPHGVMSHDIAQWAVRTAWQLIEAFSQRSGIPNNVAYAVDDLNPGDPNWPPP